MNTRMRTFALLLCCGIAFGGCAGRHAERGGLVSPDDVTPPAPIQGHTGQYMCPYTREGKFTSWLRTALQARPAENPAESPFEGPPKRPAPPTPGARPDRDAARRQQEAAAQAGGFAAIRAHSDLSFSSADDLCVYLYAKYSRQASYGRVFTYLSELYPDLPRRCRAAIRRAAGRNDAKRGGHGPGDDSGEHGPGGGGPGGGMSGPGGGMGGPGGWGGGMGGGGVIF